MSRVGQAQDGMWGNGIRWDSNGDPARKYANVAPPASSQAARGIQRFSFSPNQCHQKIAISGRTTKANPFEALAGITVVREPNSPAGNPAPRHARARKSHNQMRDRRL
ncbi:MAG TPA: hypothetical protein VHZ09_02985 [Acidobacteriaceae bacterium]|jgi:hypothetical protein|nr:hypothetical protein [Acidobacteriaceae bacterium]